jgi:hypothetical protein
MKKIVVLLCCALSVLLCVPGRSLAARAEPIYDAEIRVPSTVKTEDVAHAIRKALIANGWTIQTQSNGVIESKILWRSHSAEIRIPYDREYVRIKYVSSTNLLYNEEKGIRVIHRNYNKRIKDLERDITNRLAVLTS